MVKLSAVIITKNEEKAVGRTLSSLAFCDEIVVVDSGSTDATQEICRARGARVIVRPFDGDGPQKQFAISQASNDWVFVVDADEVVSHGLQDEIAALKSGTMNDFAGLYVPISLFFLGKTLRFGGEYGKPHLRLFDRRAGNFNANFVHGGATVAGRIGRCRGHILHYSYESLEDYLVKFNEYTSAGARACFEKKRKGAVLHVALRFPLTFVKVYLLKGCFLDGYPGLVWSLLSSFYPVVKYAKLRELQSGRPGDGTQTQ